MSRPRRDRLSRAALTTSAVVFSALGDETRIALVARLGDHGPMSVSELTDGTSVTRQAVSKHLLVLEEAGLVRGERRGRERVFELESGAITSARIALDRLSARWDVALERLRKSVEE